MANFASLSPPYGAIVVDPPWTYKQTGKIPAANGSGLVTQTSGAKSASKLYTTMSRAEIAALPVGELAAENAHIYLWVTNPLIFEQPTAEEILAGWGFTYKTLLTWCKSGKLGMGFYWRGATEHVAFGVRGKAGIEPARRLSNVLHTARFPHSVKPAAFYDLVERVSPGPYVDLFNRQPRFGWDSWGHGYEQAVAHV